ncbi:hypothetical protein FHX44_117534 [Pseudonocardia hierapolitana]|uniref:DUF1579 domain-containing protein n=1 Tax=Pseudonocardia hierapolitana TaxID=1128676 RepID=A0A561T3A5_9PSEU|nr:hypothetical protein [Pseudonocardia hierapolitana]TWF81589.1 hypothetical protein FHX44_117534 [Pseudonocardia hierapolitana]
MGADIAAWEPIIGSWASSGRTVEGVEIAGTDVYEWLPGRRFVVHRVDVRMGGEQVNVLEVIGERDGDAFLMRSFEGNGGTALMRATVDDAGVWTFAGPTARATLVVAGSTMTARWERTVDGAWEHWMDMGFRRTSQRSS